MLPSRRLARLRRLLCPPFPVCPPPAPPLDTAPVSQGLCTTQHPDHTTRLPPPKPVAAPRRAAPVHLGRRRGPTAPGPRRPFTPHTRPPSGHPPAAASPPPPHSPWRHPCGPATLLGGARPPVSCSNVLCRDRFTGRGLAPYSGRAWVGCGRGPRLRRAGGGPAVAPAAPRSRSRAAAAANRRRAAPPRPLCDRLLSPVPARGGGARSQRRRAGSRAARGCGRAAGRPPARPHGAVQGARRAPWRFTDATARQHTRPGARWGPGAGANRGRGVS
jgi:hypothetical protein